ncbi:MAG: metallophosphoesterase [Lachnospiraceae bacterium]|nr:metallophosphoesterase [Lachnospiraceae bacterium]
MKIIVICLILLVLYVIWQQEELKKFEVTTYEICSDKIKNEMNLVMISDLHSHVYGKQNDILWEAVRKQKPDLILIPGDMIVSKKMKSYDVAYQAFRELTKIAPVYFSNGNHESRPIHKKAPLREAYLSYETSVKELGVHILNNTSETVTVKENNLCISGLEIDLSYYTKGKVVPLEEDFLEKKLGQTGDDDYQILLAHNPMYSEQYVKWGANLTLCGHNHGGLVRLPGIGSLISPQFQLFPKYDAGRFDFHDKTVIVGRGLGTHTFHIRIFNRAELVCIHLRGK